MHLWSSLLKITELHLNQSGAFEFWMKEREYNENLQFLKDVGINSKSSLVLYILWNKQSLTIWGCGTQSLQASSPKQNPQNWKITICKNHLNPQSPYTAHFQLLTFSVIRWQNPSHSLLIPSFRLVPKDDYVNKIWFYFQVLIQHFLFLNHSYMISLCSSWAFSVYAVANSWLALNNYTLIIWVFTLHNY